MSPYIHTTLDDNLINIVYVLVG